jgi:hypothetical protein
MSAGEPPSARALIAEVRELLDRVERGELGVDEDLVDWDGLADGLLSALDATADARRKGATR